MRTLYYIRILRPKQWLKNLILFFPPFLAGVIFNPGLILKGIVPFVCFCIVSSSTYIFNDIIDHNKDMHHPKKRHRAIPSGNISIVSAYCLALTLLAGALIIAFFISNRLFCLLLIYVAITATYSLILKELPIVDIFCISAGFLIRLQAGGEAFGVVITEWLFLCVFLLSLFLSTGKRLCERNSLGHDAGKHRKTLNVYPPGFLEGTLYMTSAAVLVTYTIYVISRHTLVYTVPLCCFGLLRYIFRVKCGFDGDPTESLLKDKPLFAVGILWTVMVGWSIYYGR
jgi:decaprenyl-phosphate phosphoribosyltransferase